MTEPDLSVQIATVRMKNPVMVASGTFGYGLEYSMHIDVSRLGAIVLKSITLEPWPGNPPPRIAETPSGMLNAIGIENIGVRALIAEQLPALADFNVPVIANVMGREVADYAKLAEILNGQQVVAAIELNTSCPNVGRRGPAHSLIAQHPQSVSRLVKTVRDATTLPLIVKLSPDVTHIGTIAHAAEQAGADAVSLVNSFPAMAIDVETRLPSLANVTGGLTGPAIRPIAVKKVWDAAKAVSIPVIGMGGIASARDALEFIIAGASAVAVGSATFAEPETALNVIDGIEQYMSRHGIATVSEIVGTLKES